MKGELIILGCGGSSGVPAIGNYWGACNPDNPKNTRTRPSVAVVTETTTLIVDTGPDFREQYNREKLSGLDGVIYTHIHSDHTNGIDDIRTFQRRMKKQFPIYADKPTLDAMQHRFHYMFKTLANGFYPAVCLPHELIYGETTQVGDVTFIPFRQDHGTIVSVGLRFSRIGYSTDMKSLDEDAIEILKGIDTWIVDAAAYESCDNPVHTCIDCVIEMNGEIGAKDVYLTHLPPTMDYDIVTHRLPDGYKVAYDGLRFDLV